MKSIEAAGSEPFTYEAKGKKKIAMSYWRVPEDVLEDAESLGAWAEKRFGWWWVAGKGRSKLLSNSADG